MHLHRFCVSRLTAVMTPARMFAEAFVAVRLGLKPITSVPS
jgi:hypothetical protein